MFTGNNSTLNDDEREENVKNRGSLIEIIIHVSRSDPLSIIYLVMSLATVVTSKDQAFGVDTRKPKDTEQEN
jgi:hypothetical protein